MQALLYASLDSQSLSESPGGSPFSFPYLNEGDDLKFQIRFVEPVAAGGFQQVARTITGAKASLGPVDQPPQSGQVQIQLGGGASDPGVNTTAALDVMTSEVVNGVTVYTPLDPEDLAAAINALTGLVGLGLTDCTVTYLPGATPAAGSPPQGSYYILFGNGAQTTISLVANSTVPLCFGKVNINQVNGQYLHELRFVQQPAAFTDDWDEAVAPAPTVTEEVAGATSDATAINEVQRITFPPDFQADYQITFNGQSTILLHGGSDSSADGPVQMQDALNAIAGENGQFIVTNPETNVARIEFSGALGGQPWPLLVISIAAAPTPDLVIRLSLNTFALAALLNASPTGLVLVLQISVTLEDEDDSEITEVMTLCYTSVTVVRSPNWQYLATAQNIDWLRPPMPINYVPFGSNNFLTGQKAYGTTIGDGVSLAYNIPHNLATDEIASVLVRQNISTGALLVPGRDYSVVLVDDNNLTITFLAAPADNALAVLVTAAPPVASFADGLTLTVDQITGLAAQLSTDAQAIAILQQAVGLAGGGSAQINNTTVKSWIFTAFAIVFPLRNPITGFADITAIPATSLPSTKRMSALFAAVEATSCGHISVLPGSPVVDKIYRNVSGVPILLPEFDGNPAVNLNPQECCAWDPRGAFFRVSNYTADPPAAFAAGTYYPIDYDIELFTIGLTNPMLAVGYQLQVLVGLQSALLKANCDAQYELRFEWGYAQADAGSGITLNLRKMNWQLASPIGSLPLLLTDEPSVDTAGLVMQRSIKIASLPGTTVNTNNVVPMASTAGLFIGMKVSGPGIQAGSTITGLTPNVSITLSLPATAGAAVTLTFVGDQLTITLQYYGQTSGALNTPDARYLNGTLANGLGLRCYLRAFDCEKIPDARGLIALRGPNATAATGGNATGVQPGQALISFVSATAPSA